MTTTIISNSASYGGMTNQAIAKLISLQTTLQRLADAIATASSGYEGTAGTEFESGGAQNNLFGVQPSETPGEQGAAYKYAMEALNGEWAKFWTAAEPYIEQLDNGTYSM